MNLKDFIFGSSDKRQKKQVMKSANKSVVVRRSADTALKQYEKTFKDLARYDRGEKLAIPR